MSKEEYRAVFTETAKEFITPELVKSKMRRSQRMKKEFDKGLRPSPQAMARVYDAIIK